MTRFARLYQGKSLREVEITPLITHMLAILRNHHLQLPPEMATLIKMVLMKEGMSVRLDPEFSLGEVQQPDAKRLAQNRLSPRNLA